MNHAVDFFSGQFERQIAAGEYALNPFEEAALPYLSGRMLDLGCGLGNVSIAAARRGCDVTAIDACENACADLSQRTVRERLPIRVQCRELREWRAREQYDSVVAIGLLMFFERPRAVALLEQIKRATAPGGVAVINAMIEGSTYTAMFETGHHCLFSVTELAERLEGWTILVNRVDEFAAPGQTLKRFSTLIARRPASEAV